MDTNQDLTPKSLKYIQDCYVESFNFLQAWKRRKVRQLILLNNMQRGDETIASTLLLTLFLRTLSSQYDDKLQVKALPAQGITQEDVNAYNTLAQSDYIEMEKAKLDYDSAWDALFFNAGYVETRKFSKKRKIMIPEVINPLVMGFDPNFENVQDWRYYWKWLTKSRVEINRLIKNGQIEGITRPEEIMSGVDEFIWNYKLQRDLAKKALDQSPNSMPGNDIYQILEFYGYEQDEDSPDYGKRCCFWIDRGFTKVLYKEVLDFDDLDYGDDSEDKGSKWPIVKKQVFREPHASIDFSLADILEDKHRAKSVLLNLAYIAAKDKANPLYWYNDNVTDVAQFLSRQISQHIKLNDQSIGDNSVGPINKDSPMSPEMIQFISMLQQEANAPIGTGVVLQPQKNKSSNTATEAAIDQQLNDMAQSIQSKVMQFGESEFWSHWFHRYAKHADELKEKMANIVGVKGITSEVIDLTRFKTNYPPGFLIFSAKEAEYKNLIKRRDFMQMYPNLVQTLDPDGFRNFNKHIFFPLFLEDASLVDVVFPKTLDEIKAETENEQLMQDEMPQALPTDNHTTHIYTHNMIPPGQRTWAMWFHIEAHQQLLAQQKAQAQQAQQMQMMNDEGMQPGAVQPGAVQPGAEKQNPLAQASPLATEMNPSNNLISNNQQNATS